MERLLFALICAPVLLGWVAQDLADYLGRRERRRQRIYTATLKGCSDEFVAAHAEGIPRGAGR